MRRIEKDCNRLIDLPANRAPASWIAAAERSGDTAFARTRRIKCSTRIERAKAAWRFASRRSPKGFHCFSALSAFFAVKLET
jgi:hypothetical protein